MYIFLDIDGVLNTEKDWKKKMYSLDANCVACFKKLLKTLPDPKVVLSSTWRNGITRDGTPAPHIQELSDVIGILPGRIDRTATSPDGDRGKEIRHYLRRHPEDGYIILDDDPSLFGEGSGTEGLYIISPVTGLTDRDVRKISLR